MSDSRDLPVSSPPKLPRSVSETIFAFPPNRETLGGTAYLLLEPSGNILIDCPAGIEMGFQNAIASAREAIVVTTPEVAAVRDADRVVGLLEANDVKRMYLIINRLKPAMVEQDMMMSVKDVQDILAIPLLGVVPDDERVVVSTNRGEPLVLSETTSKASTAFGNIVRRLEGEQIPFMDLSPPPDDLLSRIRRFFQGSKP